MCIWMLLVCILVSLILFLMVNGVFCFLIIVVLIFIIYVFFVCDINYIIIIENVFKNNKWFY